MMESNLDKMLEIHRKIHLLGTLLGGQKNIALTLKDIEGLSYLLKDIEIKIDAIITSDTNPQNLKNI